MSWMKMPITMSHSPLRLAAHVRACRVGDQVILLDLLRDRYIGLGGARLAAMEAFITGGLAVAEPSISAQESASLEKCIRRLREQKFLSFGPASEPQRANPILPEVHTALTTDDEDSASAFDLLQLVRLWRATLVAAGWVRWRNLSQIADRVAALRARHSNSASRDDAEVMSAAVARYLYLRPFALTAHDRCLNDSLTLIHYLATQGLFPRWVIGVRVHPFGAHSWVQCGSVVLNDLPDHVRGYQPILVV